MEETNDRVESQEWGEAEDSKLHGKFSETASWRISNGNNDRFNKFHPEDRFYDAQAFEEWYRRNKNL